MNAFNCRLLLLAFCAMLLAPWSQASTPTPEAQQLIAELGLSEGPVAMSERSDWQPRRVVVMLIPGMGIGSPEYEQALQAAAGDVELVFSRSGSFVLSAEQLEGADGVIGFCSPPTLQAADSQLRWLHNYTVGMDRCKGLSDAQRRDMLFTNNKRLSGPAIAEHTMAMLLSLSRKLPAYSRAQARAEWQRELATRPGFGELKGKTLLVVGLGGIGTEIAWRAHGLGMRVIATRNSSRRGPEYVEYVGLADELHKLAAGADVVVNALPLTRSTTGIFDKSFFTALKPGAIFLSVGRGKSTVTADLVAALQSGQLFAAGLDVTDPEPLPADSPLWQMDNVIITPHISAVGVDSARRTMVIAVENLRRYVQGEPLLNIVDMGKGY